jgi:hypothetical protein
LLQLETMPLWIGLGVATPFPVVVVLGLVVDITVPMTEMQQYVFSHKPAQLEPTAGFQA